MAHIPLKEKHIPQPRPNTNQDEIRLDPTIYWPKEKDRIMII